MNTVGLQLFGVLLGQKKHHDDQTNFLDTLLKLVLLESANTQVSFCDSKVRVTLSKTRCSVLFAMLHWSVGPKKCVL